MTRTLATFAAVLLLTLAGCGGDDEPAGGSGGGGGGGGGQEIALSAPEDGALEFEPTELEAAAGTVTINFDNPSSTPHAVEIEGVDAKSETVTEGETSLTADLEPGEYEFFCPVGTHASQGMEGTLTVE